MHFVATPKDSEKTSESGTSISGSRLNAVYVHFVATPKDSEKTSEMGQIFLEVALMLCPSLNAQEGNLPQHKINLRQPHPQPASVPAANDTLVVQSISPQIPAAP